MPVAVVGGLHWMVTGLVELGATLNVEANVHVLLPVQSVAPAGVFANVIQEPPVEVNDAPVTLRLAPTPVLPTATVLVVVAPDSALNASVAGTLMIAVVPLPERLTAGLLVPRGASVETVTVPVREPVALGANWTVIVVGVAPCAIVNGVVGGETREKSLPPAVTMMLFTVSVVPASPVLPIVNVLVTGAPVIRWLPHERDVGVNVAVEETPFTVTTNVPLESAPPVPLNTL
jgi:hypothetical protein